MLWTLWSVGNLQNLNELKFVYIFYQIGIYNVVHNHRCDKNFTFMISAPRAIASLALLIRSDRLSRASRILAAVSRLDLSVSGYLRLAPFFANDGNIESSFDIPSFSVTFVIFPGHDRLVEPSSSITRGRVFSEEPVEKQDRRHEDSSESVSFDIFESDFRNCCSPRNVFVYCYTIKLPSNNLRHKIVKFVIIKHSVDVWKKFRDTSHL